MEITKLTMLAFQLNGALGRGGVDDVTIDEVKAHCKDGSILTYLEERLSQEFDTSLLYNDDRAELIREWAELADHVDEGRKLCVDRNGLCLVVAYLLEGIQRRVRTPED